MLRIAVLLLFVCFALARPRIRSFLLGLRVPPGLKEFQDLFLVTLLNMIIIMNFLGRGGGGAKLTKINFHKDIEIT